MFKAPVTVLKRWFECCSIFCMVLGLLTTEPYFVFLWFCTNVTTILCFVFVLSSTVFTSLWKEETGLGAGCLLVCPRFVLYVLLIFLYVPELDCDLWLWHSPWRFICCFLPQRSHFPHAVEYYKRRLWCRFELWWSSYVFRTVAIMNANRTTSIYAVAQSIHKKCCCFSPENSALLAQKSAWGKSE